MENKKKIAIVIVTFNRKEELRRCLHALFQQEYLPAAIYIVDNNSSDGTGQMLKDEALLEHQKIKLHYINSGKNLGGAGGFYLGVKTAHETQLYDAYLLMDDDGWPDKGEIKEMVPFLGKYDLINAFVVNLNDETKTAFKQSEVNGNDRRKVEALQNEEGLILDYANPFNGTMISKKLVGQIGYPKAEMFIYGDEVEYFNRARKFGFQPVTPIKSIHRHPRSKAKMNYQKILCWNIPYVLRTNPLIIYCAHRNELYNICTIRNGLKIFLADIVTLYHYNKTSKELRNVMLSAIWAGLRRDFTGHLKFVK